MYGSSAGGTYMVVTRDNFSVIEPNLISCRFGASVVPPLFVCKQEIICIIPSKVTLVTFGKTLSVSESLSRADFVSMEDFI